MTGLKIETLHVDEDVPAHLQPIIEASATTGVNEFPYGGIIVASVIDSPLVSVAVGEDKINPRILDVRKVVLWDDDAAVATAALQKVWQSIIKRSPLLFDGIHVSDETYANMPDSIDLGAVGMETTGFSGVSKSDVMRLVGKS